MGISNGDTMSIDKVTFNGLVAEPPISQEIELYNFGHAPFEVIQKFQEFCMKYTSLTEALLEILERETLLKKKYTFIAAPVMYQMLAKPTLNDSDYLLNSTIDALKKFTRRGRYDSVANAIEELLFSPVASTSLCDKATWTGGNLETSYTELSKSEQTVLEKIADALLNRLSSVVPEVRKRKAVLKVTKLSSSGDNADLKISPKKRKSAEKPNIPLPQETSRFVQLGDVANSIVPAKKLHPAIKYSSNHLCPNPVGRNLKANHILDPIDASVAIPIKNFVNESLRIVTKKRTSSDDNYNDPEPRKEDFFKGILHLMPSLNTVE